MPKKPRRSIRAYSRPVPCEYDGTLLIDGMACPTCEAELLDHYKRCWPCLESAIVRRDREP